MEFLKGIPLVLALMLVVFLPVGSAIAAPSDSQLSALTLSNGSLNPVFSPAVATYSSSVSSSTASVTVTPTVATAGATVTVNGSSVITGTASQSIALQSGFNTITIVVTAPDLSGTTTYTVSFYRSLPNTATLSSLTLSAGTLSPAFSFSNYSYDVTVPNVNSTILFTPTATDSNATISISGVPITTGTSSREVPLDVGITSIQIQVESADRAVNKYYQINITRLPAAIATLADLSISDGWLTPGFSSNVTQYSVAVPNSVEWLNVFALPTNDSATVRINGFPTDSAGYSAELVVGKNTITVAVTAEDGAAAKAYTITVTRAKASDGTLSGLTVKTAALSPKFKPKTLSYNASVSKSKATVQVKPISVHKYDTIKVNGKYVKSGVFSAPVKLKPGKNVIKVVVSADGGKTITYKINITRPKAAPSAKALPKLASGKPAAPDAKPAKVMAGGKSYLQLTVRRAYGEPKPVVEVSSNLVDWFSGDKHTTSLIDDGRILRVRDNTATGPGTRRFIRVR